MEDTNQGLSTFFGAFKSAIPGISDEDLASLYKEISSNKDNPEKIGAAIAAVKEKYTKPVDKVNVTGQRMPLNYNLKSPYEGTSQEKENPDNPAASAISQFDPRALQAAQAAYKQQYDDTKLNRGLSGVLAGFGAGSAGVNQNNANWENIDKQRYLQTVGAQEALQKQSTEGLNAATTLQNMSKQAGEYEGTQKAKDLDLAAKRMSNEGAGLDLQARKDLADPGSPQTMLAKQLLIDQLKTAGNISPELMKMLQGPVSAQQLLSFMDPQVLKAFQTKVGIQSTQATTQKTNIENKFGNAAAGTYIVPPEQQAASDREALRLVKAEYDKEQNPSDKAALFREMTRLEAKIKNPQSALKAGPNGTTQVGISAGPVSIQPSPGAQVESTAAGTDRAKSAEQFKNYKTIVEPAINDTIAKLEKSYSGKGAQLYSAIVPGNEQQMIANALMQIYQSYPEAISSEIGANIKRQQGQQGWTGVPTLALSAGQAIEELKKARANVERQMDYRTKQNKYEESGGRPSEFYKTPAAGSVSNSSKTVTMKNKAGRIIYVPESKVKEAEADGFTRN